MITATKFIGVGVIVGFLACVPSLWAQDMPNGPIAKANLISALASMQSHKSKRKDAAWYVSMINEHKVSFELTLAEEQGIRRSGRYLGKKGLDDLIAAVRNNSARTTQSALYELFLRATPSSMPLAQYVQTPVKYFDYYSRYEMTRTGFRAKVLYDVANGISYFVAYIGTADPDVAIDVCKQIVSNIESYSTELKAEYEKQTGQSFTLAYGSFSPPRNFIIYQESFLQITKKNEVLGIFARGTFLTVDIRGPHDPRPR